MKYTTVKKCFLLCASILITPLLHSMEDIPETPTEGLTGWLYAQSWTLSKPQLLLYAFENNYFDLQNKTHKKLVQQALAACRTSKDIETLEKILIFIDTHFHGKNILRVATARSTHDFLTTQQTGHNIATRKQLADTQKSQLTEISGYIEKLQGSIRILMSILNGYKDVRNGYTDIQEEQLKTFRANYRKNRELTFLLHKINPSIDSEEILENCSDVEDEDLVAPSLRDE